MIEISQRTLGRTRISVTVLGYGAMDLRGAPRGRDIPEREVGRVLNTVLDEGINFIDTSIDYGASEGRIGRHLSHRRDEYILATKCGCVVGRKPTEDTGGPHEFTRENLVAGVEQSLKRLRTDYLDVVQLHHPPKASTLGELAVVETLQELQQQGKVRFIGSSAILPDLDDQLAIGAFDVFQIPYSAIQTEHGDAISRAASAGAGTIIRGAVGRGVPAGGERAVQRHTDLAQAWERAGLVDIAGRDPMAFMLRFTLSHPHVSTAIVGTANLAHLKANIAAARKGPLPDDLLKEVKARLGS